MVVGVLDVGVGALGGDGGLDRPGDGLQGTVGGPSSVSSVSGAMTMFFRPTVEDTVGDAVGAGMIGLL